MIKSIDLNTQPKLVRKAKQQFDHVRNAELLLLPERVVKLNKTGAAILRLCDGNRSVEEIARELEIEFQQDNLEPDILEFLQDVARRGWIEG